MAETRLQVPGGGMTAQELRDLVGWAGAAGAPGLRAGDTQDWLLEGPPPSSPAPGRLVVRPAGSVQSSAYGTFPDQAQPWLTTGVWMDLLEAVGDPGPLAVQLLHEAGRRDFPRMGHLRLTARKEAHRWSVLVRRPGSTALLRPETDVVDTGAVPDLVRQAAEDWKTGREERFRGVPEAPPVPSGLEEDGWEGFREEGAGGTAFGLWSPTGWFPLEHLRDLAWIAADTGAHRVWLTPGKALLLPGLQPAGRRALEEWCLRTGWAGRHGALDHAVRPAGGENGAQTARDEVVAFYRGLDRMPPGRRLLVGDEALNRADGLVGVGTAVLVRTAASWHFRSADGARSGEGSLGEVLAALANGASPKAGVPAAPAAAPAASAGVRVCPSCRTHYDPRWGDPLGGVVPGTPFDRLSAGWACPVCGGPAADFLPLEPRMPINLNLFA